MPVDRASPLAALQQGRTKCFSSLRAGCPSGHQTSASLLLAPLLPPAARRMLWARGGSRRGAGAWGRRPRSPAQPRLARPRWPVRLAASESWERQAGPDGAPGTWPLFQSSLSRDRGCPGGPRRCGLTLTAPALPACLARNLSPFTPTVSRKTGSRVSRMFSMSHKSPPPKVPQPNRLDEVYEALKKGLT